MITSEAVATIADWATVVTAGAIVTAIISLLGEKQQRHREFENLYVQRYWSVLDRMPDSLRERIPRLSRKNHRAALDYLRLCEDQLDMRRLGFITHKTWSIWGPAILDIARLPAYASLLEKSPPSELEELKKFALTGSDPYAAERWSDRWIWSKVNGL